MRALDSQRGRLQFRLKTILAATAVVALACWLYLAASADYRCRVAVRDELRRRGFMVMGELTVAYIAGEKITDESFRPVAELLLRCGGPKQLDLTDSRIHDLGLATKMDRVEYLNLSGSAVDDASLTSLVGMKNLQRLWLFDTNVTDACIPSLCAIPALRNVALTRTLVTARGVGELRTCKPGIEIIWSNEEESKARGGAADRGLEKD